MAHDALKLPATIISPADLVRAKRDLETYNEDQHQADLRARQSGKAETIHAGRVISELAALNDCELTHARQRSELLAELESALKLAPTVTMSFATDPSAALLAKLVDWLRDSIHPQILVRIGLQPNIAAGFTLKTPSRIYDFSLRQRLLDERPALIQRLRSAVPKTSVSIAAPTREAGA